MLTTSSVDEAAAFILGLAQEGVVFVRLHPNTKQPQRGFDYFRALHKRLGCPEDRVLRALSWLREGAGTGYLIGESGLYVVDADDAKAVAWMNEVMAESRIFCPMVSTPSGGRHYLMRLPPDWASRPLKCHTRPPDAQNNKQKWDFKLSGNTLLVAPGTRRDGRAYTPLTAWSSPPPVDPTLFAPAEALVPDPRLWQMAPGDDKRRRTRAWIYLRNCARVSRSGSHGRDTLMGVCTHLTRFLGVPVPVAFHLLVLPQDGKPAWNSRCLNEDGKTPYPWSQRELFEALKNSLDLVPEAGVKEHMAETSRKRLEECLVQFGGCLRRVHRQDSEIRVEDAQKMFQEWAKVEISATTFGAALTKMGIPRKRGLRKGEKVRLIPGVDAGEVGKILEVSSPPTPPAS